MFIYACAYKYLHRTSKIIAKSTQSILTPKPLSNSST